MIGSPRSTEIEAEEIESDEANNTLNEFISFLRDIIIILIIVLFIRWVIITPFRINGSSMENSYHDKEYILVDKLSYLDMRYIFYTPRGNGGIDDTIGKIFQSTLAKIPFKVGEPKRGDVVVLTPHVDASREYYIKRIIGMPGDIVRIEGGYVFIETRNGSGFIRINEPYLSITNSGNTTLPPYVEDSEFRIPEEMYWVMGDNRSNSADSRSCFKSCTNGEDITAHFIKRSDVLGKVFLSFGYFNIFQDNPSRMIPEVGELRWIYSPRFFDHPKNATYPELD